MKPMSASSWVAQDADDAMDESSLTALAKEKERDWWSVDLEGAGPKADAWIPKGRRATGQLGQKKKVRNRKENEKQEKEAEVEEAPHEASAEVQSPKRKEIRAESSRKKRLRAKRPW